MSNRQAELAKIHIAKAQLGLDEDAYRAMLWSVARVESAADLDEGGRRKVLAHLRSRGATFERPSKRPSKRRPQPDETISAQVRKIEALLADGGKPWAYAHAIAKRQHGVERVEWCTSDQLRGVITALVEQTKREKEGA